jgi:hypothetical protein
VVYVSGQQGPAVELEGVHGGALQEPAGTGVDAGGRLELRQGASDDKEVNGMVRNCNRERVRRRNR